MNGLLNGLAIVQGALRVALFWGAVIVAVVAVGDWLVRTRRISPFSPIARWYRRTIDPLLVPVERRVVSAGGLPASAPWWALAAVVIGGILLMTAVDFLINLVIGVARGVSGGPRGLLALAVDWAFMIAIGAILVSVIVSWLPVSRFSPWVRWAFTISEPILRPLRRLIPPFGSIDITPIVAFFLLSILQGVIVSMIR